MFEAIHSRLERISQYAVWVGGAALLAAAVMVTVDVFARKFFSITMSGSDEYSGYVFSATTTMAYSYCLLHRSNVRIDALYNLLPRQVTAFLDVIGLSLLLYYMSIMCYYAVISFQMKLRSCTCSRAQAEYKTELAACVCAKLGVVGWNWYYDCVYPRIPHVVLHILHV
mgnify:CR=1 FL=1